MGNDKGWTVECLVKSNETDDQTMIGLSHLYLPVKYVKPGIWFKLSGSSVLALHTTTALPLKFARGTRTPSYGTE